jgi:hypothetical protein
MAPLSRSSVQTQYVGRARFGAESGDTPLGVMKHGSTHENKTRDGQESDNAVEHKTIGRVLIEVEDEKLGGAPDTCAAPNSTVSSTFTSLSSSLQSPLHDPRIPSNFRSGVRNLVVLAQCRSYYGLGALCAKLFSYEGGCFLGCSPIAWIQSNTVALIDDGRSRTDHGSDN